MKKSETGHCNFMTTQALEKQEKKPQSVKEWLKSDYMKEQVAMALPTHLTADRFLRTALTAMTRTPKLAQCTQESVIGAMMTLSELGLEPDGRRAHLIPYGKDCQLIIDYKGLVELVMRSGEIANIHADVVCEGEQFVYNLGQVEKHVIDFTKKRGVPYAAYCVVRYKDPSVAPKCEVMQIEDIEGIRKRSKAANAGPWKTDYNEMAKKTVFRRCSKWLPLSAEVRDKIEKDDDQFIDISTPKAPKFEVVAPITATAGGPNPVTLLRGEFKEEELMEYLRDTGSVDESLASLEEVYAVDANALQHVVDNIDTVKGDMKARE